MAILKLTRITCNGASESTDELYVRFNGAKRSLPNMNTGQTADLADEFLFEGSRELSLFENDGNHWWDRDDFIDARIITEKPADTQQLDFRGSPSGHAAGARYVLDVSIAAGP